MAASEQDPPILQQCFIVQSTRRLPCAVPDGGSGQAAAQCGPDGV